MKRIMFSKHALDRVKERLSLSPQQIANIINSDKAVLLGKQSGGLVYKFFYSGIDEDYFVAVQDKNDRISTILPEEYYRKQKYRGWKISSEIRAMAKFLQGFGPKPEIQGRDVTSKMWFLGPTTIDRRVKHFTNFKKIIFYCDITDSFEDCTSLDLLEIWMDNNSVTQYIQKNTILDKFLKDPEILKKLREQLAYLVAFLEPGEKISDLYVKTGTNRRLEKRKISIELHYIA